jgi:F420H(2)-dependent quinone reductase
VLAGRWQAGHDGRVKTTPAAADFERDFFRVLNACLAPVIRAGLLSPTPLTPLGVVLLETIGRKSAVARPVPLLAFRAGEALVVSTARGERSQWVRNVEANGVVRYWLGGVEHAGVGIVVRPGVPVSVEGLPPAAAKIRAAIQPYIAPGWAVAVIVPA